MLNKFALGTVQFGLNYGINNTSGQVSSKEISKILHLCKSNGIDVLDTAYAYGESESVLGNSGVDNFQIVTKVSSCSSDQVASLFNESLERLRVSKVYGYLIHNFSIFKADKKIWNELKKLKADGKVEKIGLSLYSPEELYQLWEEGIELDLVQIPYNLFDRRFDEVLSKLKEKGVEVHARSAFLQGLFFKSNNQIPKHFETVKDKLNTLDLFCKNHKLDKASVCLGFVALNPNIDKVVFGVDNSIQLKHNIDALRNISDMTFQELNNLQVDDLNIINPSLWQLA